MGRMRVLVAVLLFTFLAVAPSQATYTQQVALAQDPTFQGQVLVAEIVTAANVMTEAVTVAGHTQRATFARQVLQDPTKWNQTLAFMLAGQANNPMTPLTVPSTVADTLVQSAMDAQWSNVSGYFKQ